MVCERTSLSQRVQSAMRSVPTLTVQRHGLFGSVQIRNIDIRDASDRIHVNTLSVSAVSVQMEGARCWLCEADSADSRQCGQRLIGHHGAVYTQIVTSVIDTSDVHRLGSSCIHCHPRTRVATLAVDVTLRIVIASDIIEPARFVIEAVELTVSVGGTVEISFLHRFIAAVDLAIRSGGTVDIGCIARVIVGAVEIAVITVARKGQFGRFTR